MIDESKAILIDHEGEKLHAYQDSEGYWTIGVGHLIDERLNGAIPQRISRELLEDDLNVAIVQCRINLPFFDGLDQIRQDAFTNLMFNMGPKRLKGFGLMLEAAGRQDWERAAYELFNSKWRTQVQKKRVDDLMRALEKGVW